MKKRHSLAIISFILFIFITILIKTNNISWFDDFIYNIIKSTRCVPLDYFFKTITHIVDTVPLIITLVVILVFIKEYKERLLLGSSIILTLGINQIIKYIVERPRPPIAERLISQGGYSFPSGHSMMSMCVYGMLIYLVAKKEKDKKKKRLIITILSLLIILIGISRIYVRVHWPSDVLGGFLLTIAIIIENIELNKYFNRGKEK